MTLAQFADALGVNRNIAAKIAAQLPGAVKESPGPGQIPRWVLPDNALDLVTEEVVQAAREAVSTSSGVRPAAQTGFAAAGLAEDEAAVRREQLAASRVRAEADRLKAELELERLKSGSHGGAGENMMTFMLLQRLDGLERKLEAASGGGQTSGLAALAAAFAPVLTPLVTKFAARPGLSELLSALKGQDPLAVARELKALGVVGAQDTSGAVSQAKSLLELITLLRPLLAHGREDGGFWAALAPEVPTMLGRVVDGVRDIATSRARIAEIRRGAAPTPTSVPPAIVEFQAELERAAAQHLVGFFPTLRQKVLELWPQGGAELLAAVAADPAADAVAMERLSQGGIRFTPAVTTFLKTFAHWLRYTARQQAGAAPAATNGAPGAVRVQCRTCNTVYALDDESQWASDSKLCDAQGPAGGPCRGPLVRIEAGQDEARR